jgi:hypothetical protein
VHAKHRLNLLLALALLGCGRVRYGDEFDAPEETDSGSDVPAPLDAAAVLDAPMPDAFSTMDAFALPDAAVLPDAFMPDAFTPLDARMPDAFIPPDAFTPPDAFVPPDARPACGDLRLYFRFENAAGMLLDESGCGNHGTPMSVLFGEPSPRGVSYRFARPFAPTPATVQVSDSASLSGLTQLTVEAWVRQEVRSSSYVVSHGDGMDGDPFAFGTLSAGEPTLAIPNSPTCTGVNNPAAPVAIPVNTWTHIAVTLDIPTREVVFLTNGVEVSRAPSSIAMGTLCDNPEALVIGALRRDGTLGFQGWIDELRIWAVVRTQVQVCVDAGGVPGAGGTCIL